MKVELFPFQQRALASLREKCDEACRSYERRHAPQVISFTAPTGAGKTIIMASLIESIYFGEEFYVEDINYSGTMSYPEEPDAIFVWLSDSPELNAQSRKKIDYKADKIRLDQCVTSEDESFDREMLEDGHIYFLNTQKLGVNSNLTKRSDSRQYTIWETIANTVREKPDHLYFIIDEAHRGMQGNAAGRATTIMQKFILGSREEYATLPPMPVVIGMSATIDRFNKLVGNTTSTIHKVPVTPEEVRASGLLKDKIVIRYPESQSGNHAMAVLQAAADEWKNKWDHWYQYCQEQHYAYVNPVFVIQVENGTGSHISETDLDECVRKIEERTGFSFDGGEIVHTFGQTTSTLQVNGIDVPYVEPSNISEDKHIKIVFFKENLSTGWDCPRAETMMSFRHASDSTYIAQLLGRMVRTPMQMHILVDDSLNDVHLYLPFFNSDTVNEVVEYLSKAEGGDIPTDIAGEEIGNEGSEMLTIRPQRPLPSPQPTPRPTYPVSTETTRVLQDIVSQSSQDAPGIGLFAQHKEDSESTAPQHRPEIKPIQPQSPAITELEPESVSAQAIPETSPETFPDGLPRDEIMDFINTSAILSYDVRRVRTSNYLTSLFKMARLLSQTGRDQYASRNIVDEIVYIIHLYIERLKEENVYDEMVKKVLEFRMRSQVIDVYGESIHDNLNGTLFSTTDTDVDRQLRAAESKLGKEGVSNAYGNLYYNDDDPNSYKIDVIIFAGDEECLDQLNAYAKRKFHSLVDQNRRQMVRLDERYQKQYNDIVSSADIVSEHNFCLPEAINATVESDGQVYTDHLFVNRDGIAKYNLNNWERGVLKEEQAREDFVSWLRNPPRKPWALCIPYEMDREKRPFYPDFIIIRKDPDTKYVLDILEPHDPTRTDNLGKAQGFASYARNNQEIGRLQLIRLKKDGIGRDKFIRLDMSRSLVQEKVLAARTNEELDHIFDEFAN